MKLGATHFINSSKEDPVPIVQQLTGGGLDIIFECSGDPGATVQAYWALRPSGQADAGGHHGRARSCATRTHVPGLRAEVHQWRPLRIHLHRDDIPKYCELAMRGDMMLDTIVEGYFQLEELNDIRDRMERRELNGRWICKFD